MPTGMVLAQRAEEKKVPAVNPFAKMGLKTRSVSRAPPETPTAAWVELETFRTKALELGHPSLATAALIAGEWLQREEHLFGAFEAAHYRPKECPNSVRIAHPKTVRKRGGPPRRTRRAAFSRADGRARTLDPLIKRQSLFL